VKTSVPIRYNALNEVCLIGTIKKRMHPVYEPFRRSLINLPPKKKPFFVNITHIQKWPLLLGQKKSLTDKSERFLLP